MTPASGLWTTSLFRTALPMIALAGLVLPACGDESEPASDNASKKTTPAKPAAKPLDEVRKELKAAGYSVTKGDSSGVEDALEVSDGRMTFHVVAYADESRAARQLKSFRELVRDKPKQVAVLQDTGRPERIAWAAVEEPATLPVSRFLKLSNLAIEVDPVEQAKLETGLTASAPKKKAAAPKPEPEPEPEPSGGSGITVPNVVGKDHQGAQDEMQSVGLYALREKDCTGQDRLMILDRNWTVVSQDPPGGSQVDEDTTITLCSKKDGE